MHQGILHRHSDSGGNILRQLWLLPLVRKNTLSRLYRLSKNHVIKWAEQKEKCLVVFDEITYALDYGFVDKNEFKNFIENRPFETEIVVTGRNPDDYIVKKADYITEMVKIKHPFDKGIAAREGIEYWVIYLKICLLWK